MTRKKYLTGKVIACDFDGTLCKKGFPDPYKGKPIWFTINKLKREISKGAKVILWTCRDGEALTDAIKWCNDYGIYFDAINENVQYMLDKYHGHDCRKVGADEYWDDLNRVLPLNIFGRKHHG